MSNAVVVAPLKTRDTHDPADIRATWDLYYVPGYAVELRMLRPGTSPAIGRFTDPDAFVRVVKAADARTDISGIYVTLNPVKQEAEWSGTMNTMRVGGSAAHDADIAFRRWLLVDCDPVRPTKTNATDGERTAAFDKAAQVGKALRALGWPEPVQAASGNGAHLLYRLADWPNDQESTQRVQRMLKALANQFTGKAVDVDVSVSNAGRISKVYGTVPKKGAPSEDRPWHPAVIVNQPAQLQALDVTTAKQVVRWEGAPPKPAYTPPVRRAGAPAPGKAWWQKSPDDLMNQLAAWGVTIKANPYRLADGRAAIPIECPWESSHTSGETLREAIVMLADDGKVGFKCQHAHCADRHWASDVRPALDPTYHRQPAQRSAER